MNFIKIILVLSMIIFPTMTFGSLKIETNVKSTSTTGGNVGEDVETGNASSSSSVTTKVDEGEVKVEVSAEANGVKEEEIIETSNQDVEVKKEVKSDDGRDKASINVDISKPDENVLEEKISQEQEMPKRLVIRIREAINNFFKKIFQIK